MVISHKYKYVYVETPQTGSTTIRKELIDNYEGMPVLRRHATYSEFLVHANDEEKEYFVFTSIRNPLDKIVSTFVKYKNDHGGRYTEGLNYKGRHLFYDLRMKINYEIIKNSEFTFSDYIIRKRFYPYDDISTIDRGRFNDVIRFESINEDFARVLMRIGIKQKRDLPLHNATKKKDLYLEYYVSDYMRKMALRKCAVYMNIWNYKAPTNWPKITIDSWSRLSWQFFHVMRILSWRYFSVGMIDDKKHLKASGC